MEYHTEKLINEKALQLIEVQIFKMHPVWFYIP
jgi:hypothetical protein